MLSDTRLDYNYHNPVTVTIWSMFSSCPGPCFPRVLPCCVFSCVPCSLLSTLCFILDPELPGSWLTDGLLSLSPARLSAHLLTPTWSASAFKRWQDLHATWVFKSCSCLVWVSVFFSVWCFYACSFGCCEALDSAFPSRELGRVSKSCAQVKVLLLYNNNNSSRSKIILE